MNSGIWVANKKARELMDQGVVPPETGSVARNPAAWYNLSGQFCVESYGLIAPGMPPTAADIGLHYTRIAVSEEPLQAAQFWSSLIALRAFDQGPLDEAPQQAVAAMDPMSAMAEVVADTRKAFQAHPGDWKAARQEIDAKWRAQRKWNDNSTPVNGAAVCLALLYGNGDFYRTLQYAMALGCDTDRNAATAGVIVGVRRGFKHIAALPQFKMPDHYVNKTRPQLPAECKVSEQAETLLRVAERVILANDGKTINIAGQPGYRVTAATSPSRRQFLGTAVAGTVSVPALTHAQSPVTTPSRFTEPAHDLPLNTGADVIVCGAGPAGVTAAISAARAGAKVRLFEAHGSVGGVWTSSLLGYLLDFDKPGFNVELVRRLRERDAINGGGMNGLSYQPEEMKLLLEELCAAAGVNAQLHTRVAAGYREGHSLSTSPYRRSCRHGGGSPRSDETDPREARDGPPESSARHDEARQNPGRVRASG
jgi:hypothetical protein